MLMTSLSSGHDILQLLFWYFILRQLDHMEQKSKACCGCYRPNCPHQDVHLHNQQRASQMWPWHLPQGNENSQLGVSKCIKCRTHSTSCIRILKFYHFTVFKGKKGRRNITEDFCCLSSLFQGIKWSYFFSIKTFQFRYWIPHGSLLCIYFQTVELWTL